MCPYGGKIVSGEGGLTGAHVVCHCLLIEIRRLAGPDRHRDGGRRPPPSLPPPRSPFSAAFRPSGDVSEAAVERIRGIGFDPTDVRHIACTHLDLDHAGGLPDFPGAEVHAFRPEHEAAVDPNCSTARAIRSLTSPTGRSGRPHDVDGDDWFGFESVRVLPGVDPEVLLIPLSATARTHRRSPSATARAGCCTAATPTFTAMRSTPRRRAQSGIGAFRS